MDLYLITLSVLAVIGIITLYIVVSSFFKKEKKNFTTLNLPLDNKGKWWYN